MTRRDWGHRVARQGLAGWAWTSGLAGTAALPLNAVGADHPASPIDTRGRPDWPQVQRGRLERWVAFPSRWVDARDIDVWLPDALPDGLPAGQRLQVLYMHDGQMLFDARTTWNHQAWLLDQTLGRLIAQGAVPPTMVVAVPNNGRFRHAEYYPQKFLPFIQPGQRQRHIEQALAGRPRADDYLRFLVEELKPAIDQHYPTLAGQPHPAIMGASMGGLISIYALCEYPQVFGGAAGLSTHWIGQSEPNAHLPLAAYNYLQAHLPDPATHRLYMDHGTTELDAKYPPYQPFVDEIARARGYGVAQLRSQVFPGTGHNEQAWAQRLADPLQFLLAAAR